VRYPATDDSFATGGYSAACTSTNAFTGLARDHDGRAWVRLDPGQSVTTACGARLTAAARAA
jgi:hypothetical protein